MSVSKKAYIAPGVRIVGDVSIEEDCGVWYNAVLRGDRAPVILKKGSNIQDGTVLHVDYDTPVVIGEYVTVGHNATVHACTVKDYALIGMGATVLNGAVIEKGAMVAAGALVTKNTVIPEYSLAVGVPAKVVRRLTEEEILKNRKNAEDYVKEAREYLLKSEVDREDNSDIE